MNSGHKRMYLAYLVAVMAMAVTVRHCAKVLKLSIIPSVLISLTVSLVAFFVTGIILDWIGERRRTKTN